MRSFGSARFRRWARGYGITRIARTVGVTRSAAKHWITGRSIPRPGNAQRIVQASQGRVSFADIYVMPMAPRRGRTR